MPLSPDVIVLVSPHLGILDAWLPIVSELRRRAGHLHIAALLPTETVQSQFRDGDVTTELGEALFDSVYCQRSGGEWSAFNSLKRAAGPHDSGDGGEPIDLAEIGPEVRAVLFDIAEENKGHLRTVREACAQATWFSLSHGIDLRIQDPTNSGGRTNRTWRRIYDVVAYLMSENERSTYQEAFGLTQDAIKVVGVPRHAPSWIRQIQSRETLPLDQPYIFLASRPINTITFPREMKLQALKDIAQLAFQELKCGVVIRLHPKERDEELFDEAFGGVPYGEKWTYSNAHPFVLGQAALFCISLFSSVAVDMVALGVPVIERFDFAPMLLSRAFVADGKGGQTSVYQKLGLAFGARDFAELKAKTGRVLADRSAAVAKLKQAYASFYEFPADPLGFVADDILHSMSGLSEPESDRAKQEARLRPEQRAMMKVQKALAELNALGFPHELRERGGATKRRKFGIDPDG